MKTFISAILLVLPFALVAQPNPMEFKDVSITKHALRVSYYEHADEPLGESYQTYNVFLTTPSDWNEVMNENAFKSCFIQGFERIDEEDTDLSIILQVQEFSFGKDTVYTNHVKGKDGNISEYTSIIRVPYLLRYTVQLLDNKTDKLLYDKKETEKGEWKSGEIRDKPARRLENLSAARLDLQNLLEVFMEKKAGMLVPSNSWSAKYGTRNIVGETEYVRLKESKHYETYYFLAEIEKYDSGGMNKEEREAKIRGFIDYNLHLIEKYKDAMPKAYAKIRAMSYYNLANVYYWQDNFAMAREYIAKGLEAGELKSDFNRLSKDCDRYEAKLRLNNKTSRKQP